MVVGKLAKHNSLCLSLLFHQFTNSLFYQMTSNKLLWQHTFCASWINWISKIVYICIQEEATWCLKWTFLQLNTIFKHHLLKTQHPSQATQKILSLTRMRKQAGFFGGRFSGFTCCRKLLLAMIGLQNVSELRRHNASCHANVIYRVLDFIHQVYPFSRIIWSTCSIKKIFRVILATLWTILFSKCSMM